MLRQLRLAFVVATALAGASLAAQSTGARKGWNPPRTPDGQPDLQGVWTNATITPFERPPSLRDKAFLTEAEARAFERQATTRREEDAEPSPGDVGSYNQVWFDSGERVVSTRRTSLVIDPPDGRVPLRPEAEAARDDNRAHERDSYEFMSVWDRCITRGVPAGMFPAGYNNAYQIVQTRGYVVIHYEMIHEARIIPIDGRPHVPDTVRLWNGDPRGHWDGNTLVVDTTNYNNKGWIATQAAAGRIKGVPQTESLHVVERFTAIDPDTIDYRATIDDPKMYTRPWTVSVPLHRDPTYRIFEYACHEGNRSVGNILSDARALERRNVPTASLAQVKIIISGGFSAAYREVLPEFERTTGIHVTTSSGGSFGNGPNTIGAQLRRGVSADVVILSREGLSELIAEGRIVTGTDTDLAETPLGVAVRAGAPRPDISTVESFKQTLLRAASVTFTSSTSGVYLTTMLFPRLGIADEMVRKSTTSGAAAVAKGDAEIAIQPVSELLPVPGLDFVGTIPTEIQKVNVYAAAVVAGSKESEAGERLIAFLSSESATAAIKKAGMDPSRPRARQR